MRTLLFLATAAMLLAAPVARGIVNRAEDSAAQLQQRERLLRAGNTDRARLRQERMRASEVRRAKIEALPVPQLRAFLQSDRSDATLDRLTAEAGNPALHSAGNSPGTASATEIGGWLFPTVTAGLAVLAALWYFRRSRRG